MAVGVPENVTAIGSPTHLPTSCGSVMVGTGRTVAVKVWAAPVQPFSVGVTTMVAVCAVGAALVAKRLLPEPVAERPILVLLFVQL